MTSPAMPIAHRRQRRFARRGLAPLELVLALPLLLMVLALMVIVGTAGAWKVRTLTNGRQAIFRAMYPRTTDNDPKPENYWPSSGSLSYRDGGPAPFTSDPYARHRVVRGPTIADPATGNTLNVLIDTLDMQDGMRSGRATINHQPAMWPKLGVRNAFARDNVLFAGQTWQYGNMGVPFNDSRRILYTYDYALSRYDPAAAQSTNAAAAELRSNPYRNDLQVLDRDAELRAWHGRYIDFHPRPASLCTNDPVRLQRDVLEPLLERIEDVPRRMAGTFLQMYQGQLQALSQMNPPPPDFASRAAELGEKIQQLQDFLRTL